MAPEGLPSYESPEVSSVESNEGINLDLMQLAEAQATVETAHEWENKLKAEVEQNPKIAKMLGRFEQLASKKWIEGFDVFKNFIQDSPENVKEDFLDRNNLRKVKNSAQKNWKFPTNIFELSQIIVIEKTWAEEVAKSNEKVSENFQKIENFKHSMSGIELRDSRLGELLQKVELLKNKEESLLSGNDRQEWKSVYELRTDIKERSDQLYKDIVQELTNTKEIEKTILPQARKSGNYEEVKNSLIALGGWKDWKWWAFESRILAWEIWEKYQEKHPPEQKMRTGAALLWNEATDKSGNIFSLDLGEWESIDYDVVTGSRTMELDGYRLQSEVSDTADWQTPKLEYMEVEQATLPKIKKISEASNMLSAEMINSGEVEKILATVKKWLGMTYFNELWLWSLTSWQAIRDVLKTAYRENNNTLTEARNNYKEALNTLQAGQIAAIKKKDEKVRGTLKYFQSIGFTEIPQYITDQVVETLNSDTALRASLWFSEELDFANGQLGMDRVAWEGEWIDLQDKIAFAEFVNKMLWFSKWNKNAPINVSALSSWSTPVGDRGKFETQLRDSWLLDVGWFGKIMENLTQAEESTDKEIKKNRNK